ncbi:MAG: AsmA family protein [Parvibaculum sp.]|uniref:AsmA family protein n=1 Tax=Parvibaculum sp. TaxID=2024848 RepID=UPI0025D82898|nr:AsmA family protein [Parvibaculum sp.]MCE9649810.1 AsmA family protein [Parvibaculum sp.]
MSRWIAIIAGIVVLLIAAVIAVPMLIPSNVYKQRVVALVKSQTGRDLVIGGDVGLSFFPRLAVKVEDVRFSNAAWGKDKDMAAMKEMRAALKILPLFKGEVEIDSFVLVDPVIHLEVKADGTPNWQFETAGAPAAATPAEQSGSGASVKQIRLGEVSVQNGVATYRNAQTGASLAFEKVDVDLSLPGLDEPFEADGSLVWNSEPLKLSLKADRPRALTEGGETPVEFSLTSSKIGAAYKGSVQALGGTRFSGDVDLNVPSVREFAQWLGSPLPAGNGFGPLSIKGTAQGSGNSYTFSNAQIGFDGMNATGKLAVQTGGARPMIRGELAFDRIDTNIYTAPSGAAAAPVSPNGAKGGGTGGGGWSNEPIDLSGLKAADADISLSTKELLVKEIKIGESALNLKLANGTLTADLDKLALYKGAGSGSLTLDGSGRVPQIEASFSIAGVQAEPLLTDAAGFSRLSGLSAISFSVDGAGRSQREIVGTLGGKGEVKFTNGAIKGVNLAQLARTVLTAPATGWQSGGSQDTDFSELGGTFTIAKGILSNSDLKLLSPLIRVGGAGTVDLPNQSLNYRVEPKLAATLEGQGGGAAKGIEVPIIIDGPWASPRFRPDLASMIQNREQTIETIKSLKGEGGKEMLKGLLGGQKSEQPADAPAEGSGEKVKPQDALKKLFGG